MKLYHGSYKAIERPDLSFSRLRTDFGRGFYTTPILEQAKRWAKRFQRDQGMAVVSEYDFLLEADDYHKAGIRVLDFTEYNTAWLRFITACRLGQAVDSELDMVIGGVANDKVFDTLQLYYDGLINADEAVGRLRYDKPNLQVCLKTQHLINDYLLFTGAAEVK